MKQSKSPIGEYAIIVLTGILLALNYILFIVPNGFAPAGINGIAVMVQYKLHFSVAYMSLLINIPLCVLSYFTVNRRFAVRSLVFCLIYSFAYLLLQKVEGLQVFRYNANNIDTIYPVMIAGLISGLVYGILFRLNACTGGTDIIARYVAVKHPALNFFWVTFVLNAVVAFSSYFVYADEVDGVMVFNLKPVCLCLLYCFLSSYVGTRMLNESRSACEFIIITNHPQEIEKEITANFHHSATRWQGEGVFSGKTKTVLLCLVNKHQSVDFEHLMAQYPDTFCIKTTVNGTVGNFKHYR